MTRVKAAGRAPHGFHATRSISGSAFFSVFEVLRASDDGTSGATASARGVCKRLTSRGLDDDEARASLVREGAVGESLHRGGASVAEVLARGEDEAGPYLVTRFVEGETLRRLRIGDVDLDLAARAFAALDDVHRAGVVHGDVHLDNLIRSAAGPVVVVDFGLAAAPPSSAFRGTAMYAAPEAARGEAPDATSDRFSLAAALLHHASGVAPRSGTSAAALLYEAGTTPLDGWLARISQGDIVSLATQLSPFLRFERGARPLGPFAPRGKKRE